MNILFLNTTYICGGAEKVTNQIMDGMKKRGHQVYEIISYHKRPEPLPEGVFALYQGTPMLIFNRLLTGNHNNASLTIPYSKYVILKFIKEKHIDVVHLHNAHGNFLGIRDIHAIADVCPIIWTVHDFWPMTGHCTSPTGCDDRWHNGCTTCPQLSNYPPLRKDIAHNLFKEKKRSFSHPNIYFVTPSYWMLSQVQQSFLKAADCQCISNSLDINHWTAHDKEKLRCKYDLPQNKRILAFVAADPSKKSKGMHLLIQALQQFESPDQYLLLIAGQTNGIEHLSNLGFHIKHFGYINDQKKMNEFYSLADILINPSLYETFGLVNIEAMASGTPVIAFPVCAMKEIIPPECGWCLEETSGHALSKSIQSAYADTVDLSSMGNKARMHVENVYSEQIMLTTYENLYEQVKKPNR